MTSAAPLASLLQLYQDRLGATPERIAVSAGQDHFSYRELDRRANGVAAQLRPLETAERRWVAVLAGRSIALVVGQLSSGWQGKATLKAL